MSKGDVVQVVVIRKESEGDKFKYPQKAAEYAIALDGETMTDAERERLYGIFRQLLELVGY